MNDIRIGAFIYSFPHWKTQNGLFNLCFKKYKPALALAADSVKLNFYQSKIRTSTKGLFLQDGKSLCEFYDIPYYNTKHNSDECIDIIKRNKLDLGIILGARILSKEVIDSFKIGIINMHPGILPQNRGLDNIKWSVFKNYPIGVSAHFINEKIDMGELITQRNIEVLPDDEFLDLCVRNQNLEQGLMIESLDKIKKEGSKLRTSKLSSGNYHKAVNPEIEKHLYEHVTIYKRRHLLRGLSEEELYYFK